MPSGETHCVERVAMGPTRSGDSAAQWLAQKRLPASFPMNEAKACMLYSIQRFPDPGWTRRLQHVMIAIGRSGPSPLLQLIKGVK